MAAVGRIDTQLVARRGFTRNDLPHAERRQRTKRIADQAIATHLVARKEALIDLHDVYTRPRQLNGSGASGGPSADHEHLTTGR
jgi:hypothetical protein